MLINSYSAGQQLNEQEKYTALYEEAAGGADKGEGVNLKVKTKTRE